METQSKTFSLLQGSVTYSARQLEYYRIRNQYRDLAATCKEQAENEFYTVFSDFDALYERYAPWLKSYLEKGAVLSAKLLVEHDHYDLDPDRFLADFFDQNRFHAIAERIREFVSSQQKEHEQNEKERAERTDAAGSAWMGGGFGIKGAIKGAVKAEALNLAGAAISEAFNAIGRKSELKRHKEEQKRFFEDIRTKKAFASGIYNALADMDIDLFRYTAENYPEIDIEPPPDDNVAKSRSLLSNMQKGIIPKDKIMETCLRALALNPLNGELYIFIGMNFPEEQGVLQKMIRCFGVDLDWEESEKCYKHFLKNDPENAELYLLLCMAELRISGEEDLRKACVHLENNKSFQSALRFASPERRKQLETIQALTLSNCYLKQYMQEKKFFDETRLPFAREPLAENGDFQKAVEVAPPERKQELQRIVYEQAESFLQRCMEKQHVSSEDELLQITVPLAEDSFFQLALKYAAPDRQKELRRIAAEQAERLPEIFLKRTMVQHHVSSENELSDIPDLLTEDVSFQQAMKYASPERRQELQRIVYAQAEYFVKQCLKKQNVSSEDELSQMDIVLIQYDKDFQKALEIASPERKKELQKLQMKQEDNQFKNQSKTMLIVFVVIVLIILCAGILMNSGVFE